MHFLRAHLLKTVFAFAALFVLLLPFRTHAASPLDTLRVQHPRLFLHDSDLPALKRTIATDPFVKQQFEELRTYADKLLTAPPDVYVIGGVEHTLLDTSRDMEGRVFALAGLYRLTGDKRYADRATKEMLAAASFPDWYPTHFLDTGEMTATLGLGYDWLYSVLSPADRATIKNAIATKGIDPWLERIKSGDAIHHEHNNWNQVCNGGESIGALAIADEDPARATAILDHAHFAITNIMKLFAPDGGFEEGPTYWLYATAYNLMYIDALDTALGTDFGVADETGFSSTGDYHIQADGPTYLLSNFGDAGLGGASPTAQMFWLARRFNKPFYAAHERDIARVNNLAAKTAPTPHGEQSDTRTTGRGRFALMLLLWSAQQSQAPSSNSNAQLPLVQNFARVDQAYLRSAWNDPNAWYIGFKGGDAHASHGHLDLGSFVMDAFGQRWASDLGPDSYGLSGYFGPKRWSYYRMRTEGHNTLTINGLNEDLDSKAPLTSTGTIGNALYSIADLSQTYKGKLTSWSRGVALLDKQRVLVQDEIAPAQPVDVVWNFHTFATVAISKDGHSATLTQDGATLQARILSPASARFDTASTQPPPPQEPNPGLTNLVIQLFKQTTPQTIAVLFTKSSDDSTSALKPLSTWKE
ncbi:MAG TPA: heparinase II/III family protein [Terracidiphilus sp.]|nr:heparinase II/III family protein [Terracidiphilus sp.]